MKLTELMDEVVFSETAPARGYRVFPAKTLFVPGGERIDLNASFFAGIVQTFKERGLKIQIDFNHQSAGAMRYEDGAAAGWVTDLTAGPDGLFATIEWTAKGTAAIRDKEYLYLSPEFELKQFDQDTGETIERPRLLAVALTNRPYLSQQAALAASDSGITKEILMDKVEIDKLRAAKEAAELAVAEAQAAMAIMAQGQKDGLLQAAVADGRVAPALVPQLQAFSGMVGNDVKKFSDFLAALPVPAKSGPTGQIVTQGDAPTSKLSEADKAACSALSLNEADYLKYGTARGVIFERGKKMLVLANGQKVEA